MRPMNERAMLILLQEWHRQLAEALEEAKSIFPDPEPERVRQWVNPFAIMFREPIENDPPDQWQWIEIPHTPPHLLDLEMTIDRIGGQIEELKDYTKRDS